MGEIKIDELDFKLESIEHWGIVAGIARDLGLAEKINARLSGQKNGEVSVGDCIVALVLSGLIGGYRNVHFWPYFFSDIPLNRFLGIEVTAEDLCNSFPGALSAVHEYGVSRLFSEIALEIGQEKDLIGKFADLSINDLGLRLENDEEDFSSGFMEMMGITQYGMRARMSFVFAGPASFPVWVESVIDNEPRAKTKTTEKMQKLLELLEDENGPKNLVWLANSGLYAPSKLLSIKDISWICRVPETVKEARAVLSVPETDYDWQNDETTGYRYTTLEREHANIKQRWIIVFQQSFYDKAKKALRGKVSKELMQTKERLGDLMAMRFSDQPAAEKACQKVSKKLKFHEIKYDIISGKDDKFQVCDAKCVKEKSLIEQHLQCKSRFMLACNVLDKNALTDEEILQAYYHQKTVERGIRFLRRPVVSIDQIFSEKEEDLEAMMFVVALCLMIYNVGQYELRQTLKAKNETLPDLLDKETNKPTLRRVFDLMHGFMLVKAEIDGILQLIPSVETHNHTLKQQIIRYFSKTVQEIYEVE